MRAVGKPTIRPSGETAARGVIPDRAIQTPIVPDAGDPVLEEALRIVRGEVRQVRPGAARQD